MQVRSVLRLNQRKCQLGFNYWMNLLKRTVDYYVNYYVNACIFHWFSFSFPIFIDFEKAFDYVNYWKLFTKLFHDNIESNIAVLLACCYSNQQLLCVWWFFSAVSNGTRTRRGGVLSQYVLFWRRNRDLLHMTLNNLALLQHWGVFTTVVVYADYIVLTAPSWKSVQDLLMYFTSILSISIWDAMNVKQCALFSNPNDDYRLYLVFRTA